MKIKQGCHRHAINRCNIRVSTLKYILRHTTYVRCKVFTVQLMMYTHHAPRFIVASIIVALLMYTYSITLENYHTYS